MGVEQLDQLGEVGEGASQAIDLVDDDDVDPLGAHVVWWTAQPLSGRRTGRGCRLFGLYSAARLLRAIRWSRGRLDRLRHGRLVGDAPILSDGVG